MLGNSGPVAKQALLPIMVGIGSGRSLFSMSLSLRINSFTEDRVNIELRFSALVKTENQLRNNVKVNVNHSDNVYKQITWHIETYITIHLHVDVNLNI